MSRYDSDGLTFLPGHTVTSVVAGDSQATLHLDTGESVVLDLYGDCCSQSFYTDPAQFNELVGAKVQAVAERAGESPNGGETSPHFLVFETDRGHVTIDWRNESNGYYDGWVASKVVKS